MIPFIMQLKLPHVLVGMHTDYLYQELEPPLQKVVFIFVVAIYLFYLISDLSKTGFHQKVRGLYKGASQVTQTDLLYN